MYCKAQAYHESILWKMPFCGSRYTYGYRYLCGSAKVPYGIPVVLLFDLAAGFIIYFVFRNTSVEFEYDYFGGELTVDKILNRAKRKRLRIFDFAKLDYIAKYGSERMTRLEEHGNSVYYNYSAHDIREDSYVAVFHNDEKATVFLEFSPNEELLAVLKKYYPRKVYED